MDVTYGADYSAGELSPAELDRFTTYDLRFLLRYIGWPDKPQSGISHYPGRIREAGPTAAGVALLCRRAGHDLTQRAGTTPVPRWRSGAGRRRARSAIRRLC